MMNSFCVILAILAIYLCFPLNSMEEAVAGIGKELDSHRRARYSYFWTIEYYCTDKCRKNGKPYGRLIGTVCRCFCPQVDDVDYCSADADRSCSFYCKKQGYSTGDCIYQDKCFCFCRPGQPYPPCPGDDPIPEYVANSTNADADTDGKPENATATATDDKSGTSTTATITETELKPGASTQASPAPAREESSISTRIFSYVSTFLSNLWRFRW